jgi:integrase
MLEELQRRNYSPATTRGYIRAVRQFAEYFNRSPEQMGAEEVRRFQLYLLNEKKLAPGTVEIRMSALRFLYKKTLKRRDLTFDDLVFPKTPKKLPVILSPEEVTRMIEATQNLMHRTILMVLYGTGMRRTEASLLKVSDIDSERMVIHIRQGKGSRDRDVPLTPRLLAALRESPKAGAAANSPSRTRPFGMPVAKPPRGRALPRPLGRTLFAIALRRT